MILATALGAVAILVFLRLRPRESWFVRLHWLKSKCRRAWELFRKFSSEGMLYEAETMLELIKLLYLHRNSPDVPPEIERLVCRFINCRSGLLWKANQLLQHIERT